MDIEETQKINDLAKKLLSHKIASSSQDAYSRAEEIVKGTQRGPKKTEPVAPEKPEPAVQSAVPEQNPSSEIRSELDSIKDLMEKFKEGFNQLSSKLNAMAQNYENLKSEILSIKEEMKSKTVEKPSVAAADPTPAQNEQEEAKKAAEEKDMQHNTKSSYSEEDVSVDKIFYFGKK